jgi:hypothetical protein
MRSETLRLHSVEPARLMRDVPVLGGPIPCGLLVAVEVISESRGNAYRLDSIGSRILSHVPLDWFDFNDSEVVGRTVVLERNGSGSGYNVWAQEVFDEGRVLIGNAVE